MALINYRPTEGLPTRIIGVVSLLAIGLLGAVQGYGFLTSLFGTSLGARDEKLTAQILESMVDRVDDIETELERRYVLVEKSTYMVPLGRTAEEDVQLDLDDAAAAEQWKADMASRPWQTAGAVGQVAYIGEGPEALTPEDITRIGESRNPPDTVEVLGNAKSMLVGTLAGKIGKMIVDAGAKTPLAEGIKIPNRQIASFSELVIALPDARIQRGDGALPPVDAEGVDPIVLAAAIEADKSKEFDGLEKGAPLSDALKSAAKIGGAFLVLEHRERAAGKTLDVSLRVAQAGSVFGKPVYEPTAIKLEEDIVVGGKVLVASGTALTSEILALLDVNGIERVLVDVDKNTLSPERAIGLPLFETVSGKIPAGTSIDAGVKEMLAQSLGADGTLRAANNQEVVRLEGDGSGLLGKDVTVNREVPETITLVDLEGKTAADLKVTLGEYFAALSSYNKGAVNKLSINDKPLRVRPSGEPETVTVDEETFLNNLTSLSGYLLSETITSGGVEVASRGTVIDEVSGQAIGLELTNNGQSGSFKGWKVEELSVGDLNDYQKGPNESFRFSEYRDSEGNVLIADGEQYTTKELLSHNRIEDIRTAASAVGAKWLTVEGESGTTTQRELSYFDGLAENWSKVLVLDKNIDVKVPTVVVPAGEPLSQESLDKLKALPADEQFVVLRGDCRDVKVSEISPGLFQTCEKSVDVSIPAGTRVDEGVVAILTASGISEITLAGGSMLLDLDRARELLTQGAKLVAMVSYKVGGESIAERGTPLDMDVLKKMQGANIESVTVSGDTITKPFSELEPDDVPASPKGINIVEALIYKSEELGKNTEVTEDLLAFLFERKQDEELSYPFTFTAMGEGADEAITVTGEDDWDKLQSIVSPRYRLQEAINLSGPMSKTLIPLGSTYRITWSGIISVLLFAAFLWFLLHLSNHVKLSDLLIDTESEMRKVSWPSREDVLGSSKVVIFTVFALMIYMLGADYVLDWVVVLILL